MESRPEAQISIIVPVWNQVSTTAIFLKDVMPWLKKYGAEVVVVNNGSTDGTKELLKQTLLRNPDNVALINNTCNRGFGPANNQGALLALGHYLLFMNNDVEIHGDFIRVVMEPLATHPKKLFCGRLVNWDSGWNVFNGGTVRVDYAEGWFLGMTRNVWNLIGGFDERYVPCDFEDVDLSMKALQVGVELEQLELPLVHCSGTSTRALNDRRAITEKHKKLFMKIWRLKP